MEEKWIKLGDEEISYSDFLKNASNNLQYYADSRNWSQKNKNVFFNVYEDIMNSDVIGASNDSGQWKIDTRKSINTENLSPREQGMYGEAAYFILQSMLQSKKRPKQEKKEESPAAKKYNTKELLEYINDEKYGDQDISTFFSRWNELDPRNSFTGRRDLTQRKNQLISALSEFKKNNISSYDFKETPYKSQEQFQQKIDNAIASLNSGDQSKINFDLNALGLNPQLWLNDGSEDKLSIRDSEGNVYETTYSDYYSSLQKQPSQPTVKAPTEASKSNTETSENKQKKYEISSNVVPNNVSRTLDYVSWKRIFDSAIKRGLMNLNSSELGEISNFVRDNYNKTIKEGKYKGGKYIQGYDNIVLLGDKILQLTSDPKELRRIRDNYRIGRNPSSNIPQLSSTMETKIDVGGKKLTIDTSQLIQSLPIISTSNTDNIPTEYNKTADRISLDDPNFYKKIKQLVANYIRQNKINLSQEKINELRSKGFLKYGGTIKPTLDGILNNIINKYKNGNNNSWMVS